jgi:hypothetical protein
MAMSDYPNGNPQRFRSVTRHHTGMLGGVPEPALKTWGGLEGEDIIILVLSAILVFATVWLGMRVL